jgi:hypothetical protein
MKSPISLLVIATIATTAMAEEKKSSGDPEATVRGMEERWEAASLRSVTLNGWIGKCCRRRFAGTCLGLKRRAGHFET